MQCFDELNLSNPALVAEIHREYIEAGAQIIQTNTFGANRYKLARHGLEIKMAEINTAGGRAGPAGGTGFFQRCASLPVTWAHWACAWPFWTGAAGAGPPGIRRANRCPGSKPVWT